MFNLAIDSELRSCDLVKLRVSDVMLAGSIRPRSTVLQQKTGRPVPFELTDATKEALVRWLDAERRTASDWLFPTRSRKGGHVSTRQYSRLVDGWVNVVGLNPSDSGTHSLRRT